MRFLQKLCVIIMIINYSSIFGIILLYWFYEQLSIDKYIITLIIIYLFIFIILLLITRRKTNINQNNTIEEVNNNFDIEIINTFENITINFINKECSICLEDIIEDTVHLKCNHIFHKECLKEWFKIKTTCPICRKEYN